MLLLRADGRDRAAQLGCPTMSEERYEPPKQSIWGPVIMVAVLLAMVAFAYLWWP